MVVVFPAAAETKVDCNNMSGVWKNQLGSTLGIESIDSKTGAVSGYYISPSGTKGEKYSLSGWFTKAVNPPVPAADNASVISFTVRWGDYGTITAWTGYCYEDDKGLPTLKTLWNLVSRSSEYRWGHIRTDSDSFNPSAK